MQEAITCDVNKNNLKLMLRCKALILVVLTMVAVTGMLTAVFKDIMVDNFEIKSAVQATALVKTANMKP